MSETQCKNQSQALKHKAHITMKNWRSFKIRKDSVNYLWRILINDRFRSEPLMKSDAFKSVIYGLEWCLELRRVENMGVFSLLLNNSFDKNIYVKCKLDILNVRNDIVKSEKSKICYLNKSCRRVEDVLKIPLVNRIPDASSTYMLFGNSWLYVYCEMKISSEYCLVQPALNQSNINQESIHVCKDLGILLKNQLFCDVTLSVKETQFRAHKNILAARSSVFAAMFNHPMKENLTNGVEITDIDVKAIQEMLNFIYTGKCEHLDQYADQLLIAANKYDLKGLKPLCEQALGRNLTIENAVDTLLFADLHQADELKSSAIEFIVAESPEIMNTEAWEKVPLTNPHLTIEVFKAVARYSAAVLL